MELREKTIILRCDLWNPQRTMTTNTNTKEVFFFRGVSTVEYAALCRRDDMISTKSIVISKTEKIKFEIDAIVLRKWGPHQNDSAQQDESNGMLVV